MNLVKLHKQACFTFLVCQTVESLVSPKVQQNPVPFYVYKNDIYERL